MEKLGEWDTPEPTAEIQVIDAPLAPLTPAALAERKREQLYKQLEQAILADTMAVTLGACRFTDISPAALQKPEGAPDDWEPAIPAKWLEEGLPEDVCRKMLRAAQGAWLSKRDAPSGLSIAQTTLLGLLKVDAMRSGPKTMNVTAAQVVITKNYPTVRLKGDE